MRNWIRSFLAILVGLMLISVVVEPLEMLLVTLWHGSMLTDPQAYIAVRNRPAFLALKFLYNSGGGWLGGYVAARIAGRAEVRHAVVLALVQAAALAWAMMASSRAPRWLSRFPSSIAAG